jgi:hypothetical protein
MNSEIEVGPSLGLPAAKVGQGLPIEELRDEFVWIFQHWVSGAVQNLSKSNASV